jgi:hypothetical protein
MSEEQKNTSQEPGACLPDRQVQRHESQPEEKRFR